MSKAPTQPIRIDAQTVFCYAEAFADATRLLDGQFKGTAIPLTAGIVPKHPGVEVATAGQTAPFMMCDSFALELYLKCLHAMDHGTMVWGHDIEAIYKKLKPHTKARLRANYQKMVTAHAALLSTMLKRDRPGFTSFYGYLRRSNHAFESVRYLFERATTQPPKWPKIRYWPVLRQAARKSVLDIMPEWASRK